MKLVRIERIDEAAKIGLATLEGHEKELMSSLKKLARTISKLKVETKHDPANYDALVAKMKRVKALLDDINEVLS